MKKTIVVLTGAGVSAESGINTFRGSDGLWEGHDVMEVASPAGFAKNPDLVMNFYNQRRRQLKTVGPNAAHLALAKLEEAYEVFIVTQNVDDLHERGGSSSVMHLHGELLKARSVKNEQTILDWHTDLNIGDLCPEGFQLRPHIVWFGEMVPLLETAAALVTKADSVVIIGTSMQVYPAASLVNFTKQGTAIYFIDPKPNISENDFENLSIIVETAANGVPILVEDLIRKAT